MLNKFKKWLEEQGINTEKSYYTLYVYKNSDPNFYTVMKNKPCISFFIDAKEYVAIYKNKKIYVYEIVYYGEENVLDVVNVYIYRYDNNTFILD